MQLIHPPRCMYSTTVHCNDQTIQTAANCVSLQVMSFERYCTQNSCTEYVLQYFLNEWYGCVEVICTVVLTLHVR